MKASCSWGPCPRLVGGGRILRLACAAKRSTRAKAEPSPTTSEKEHLQRSLELGPAFKQAPEFEYVAVAFRSQPRSRRNKAKPRDGGVGSKHIDGISKIFGQADDDRGYRSLELVSGDRRLLFEPTAGGAGPGKSALADAVPVVEGLDGAEEIAATRTMRARPTGRPSLAAPAAAATESSATSTLQNPFRRSSVPLGPLSPAGLRSDAPRAASPAVSPGPTVLSGADLPQTHSSVPPLPEQQQQQLEQRRRSGAESGSSGRGAAPPAARLAAAQRLAAAASLLQLPPAELRRHRGFCSELRALELTPAALAALCGMLVDALGLAPAQLRDAMLCQPHVLRVPACTLARRGAAVALELELPPPPGPGGGGPLAAIVAAVPDVLLRRASFAGTTAALAAALELPPADALELLRRQPQLLRHPPGFYALGVRHLSEQLGLQPAEAAALAAAEPQLLAVSPGVLRANGAMLRSLLQLSPEQLAEVVGRAPELLVRSPGVLRPVVQRLTAVLSRSAPWRPALPRLLASPRNLAVALSFSSDRYDRLEYLAATGRDRIIGFKEGLSLEDAEFREVFPEYEYNVWRDRLELALPHSHPARHLHGRNPGRGQGQGQARAQLRGGSEQATERARVAGEC